MTLETTIDEAREGLVQGLEKGWNKVVNVVCRDDLGMTPDLISEMTGLTTEVRLFSESLKEVLLFSFLTLLIFPIFNPPF